MKSITGVISFRIMSFLQEPAHSLQSALYSCTTVVEDIEIIPDTSNITFNLPVKEGSDCTEGIVNTLDHDTSASQGLLFPETCHTVPSSLAEMDKQSIDGTELDKQIVIILSNDSTKDVLVTRFKCHDCNQVFNSEIDLNSHNLTHSNKLEICEECSLPFRTPFLLKKHMKSHADNRQHKCEICFSLFRETSSLKYHKLKHSAELPFSCQTCCHRFTTKEELKEHVKTHGISSKKLAHKKKIKKSVKEPDKVLIETEETPATSIETSPMGLSDATIETTNCSISNETIECEDSINHVSIITESGLKEQNLDEKTSSLVNLEQNLENEKHINTSKAKSDPKTIEKPHQCKTCFRKYRKKFYLTIHERTHTGEKPFSCDICNFRTRDKSSLNNHKIKHSNERPYACDSCELKFKMKHHLVNHKLTHVEEKQYTCDVCGWSTRRIINFKAHKRNHSLLNSQTINSSKKSDGKEPALVYEKDVHNGDLYKCNLCDKIFMRKHTYLVHKRYVHLKDLPHLCDICGIKSRSQAQLKIHKLTHTGEKRFKCHYCDYSCILKTALQQHERRHTGERPYQCDTCGKTFRLKSHLRNHTRVHTRERPHKCDQCDADFRQLSALILHKTTHTTEKPFACDECDAKFRLKAELRKHKITHSVKNPFRCEDCGSIFRLKSHLQQHKKIHLITERSYKCELCPSTFRQLTHLTQHKKSHTTEKPFKCQLCPSAFRVRSNLKRHELGHIKKGEIIPQNSVENVATRTVFESDENTGSNNSFLSDSVKPPIHQEIAIGEPINYSTEWTKILRPRKEYSHIEDDEEMELSDLS